MRFRLEDTAVAGARCVYASTADSGAILSFSFCPSCGATLCWENDRMPGFLTVAAGAFAEIALPTPAVSVFTERKYEWITLAAEIARFE